MKQYLTYSEKETKDLAKKLAATWQIHHKGKILALIGELGAGKTTFIQGFAKGLGIKEKIISPTFVLIRQHKVPDTTKTLYHIDLYRLDYVKYLEQLGLEEIWSNPNNVVLIEWAEKVEEFLPKGAVRIHIKKEGDQKRLIRIS